MANTRKQYPVPKFSSLEEEDKYWQSHSPLVEEYEGIIQSQKQNRASFLSIRLTAEELIRLREKAVEYGIGPSTYARQLIIQGMESGRAALAPSFLTTLIGMMCEFSGKPKEEYLKRTNEMCKMYTEAQEHIAEQIIKNWFPSDLIMDNMIKTRESSFIKDEREDKVEKN